MEIINVKFFKNIIKTSRKNLIMSKNVNLIEMANSKCYINLVTCKKEVFSKKNIKKIFKLLLTKINQFGNIMTVDFESGRHSKINKKII